MSSIGLQEYAHAWLDLANRIESSLRGAASTGYIAGMSCIVIKHIYIYIYICVHVQILNVDPVLGWPSEQMAWCILNLVLCPRRFYQCGGWCRLPGTHMMPRTTRNWTDDDDDDSL